MIFFDPKSKFRELLLFLLTFALCSCQEERQLPRWRPFLDSLNLREQLLDRNLQLPGGGTDVNSGSKIYSEQLRPPGGDRYPPKASLSSDWESLRVNSDNSKRYIRQPGGPYFPVEEVLPPIINGSPTQSEEADGRRDVDYIRRHDERVDLKTKYFQITEKTVFVPTVATTTPTTTSTTYETASTVRRTLSRVPIIVRKVAKVPVPKRSDAIVVVRNKTELCAIKRGIDCEAEKDEQDDVIERTTVANLLPSTFEPLVKYLRGEIWVVPVLVGSGCLTIILVVYEIYLISNVIRYSRRHQYPSRRHLFLGQMLILGLIMSCAGSVMYTLKPTVAVCSTSRILTGLAYSVLYSTLLVKLVFLISLNSGVYLPATYQSLLLCFAVLIQLVIGVQWLVSSPAEVVVVGSGPPIIAQATAVQKSFINLTEASEEQVTSCNVTFQQELLGMVYVIFLIVIVLILAFKARGVRENYRESMYIGLTMGFTVAIFIVWVLAGLMSPMEYQDVCISCGLVACAAITFIIMFMPKGRQLSAMGKEGVYAEDRTDVYTGTDSSTRSTASGCSSTEEAGTPSPSFFPLQTKEALAARERLATPQSPRKLRNSSNMFDFHHHKSKNFLDSHPNFHKRDSLFRNEHSSRGHQFNRHHHQNRSGHRRPHSSHFFGSGWRSEDELNRKNFHRVSERWRRSRSSPPRSRKHSADHPHRFHGNRARATSHGDISRFINGDDSVDDDWPRATFRKMPNFRSSYDLHAANEARASRSDLKDFREQLLSRGGRHSSNIHSQEGRRPWERECQTCRNEERLNQNFFSYNPRSTYLDSDDILTQRLQGLTRY